MLVPADFAEQVQALSQSTPREAIANLLSALLPRVQASTRAPKPTHDVYVSDLDELMRRAGQLEYDAPDPMRKLTRTRRTRKTLPMGTLSYIRPNPKRGASARRYAQYQLGMTANQAIAAGLTAADILWDLDHRFIVFKEGE
jgi:hypothetical protein